MSEEVKPQESIKAGFLDWKAGEDPNLMLMFVGGICCIGIPLLIKFHHFRNAFKAEFESIDDSQHWLLVIIAVYGCFVSDKELSELEAANGITGKSTFPWWLALVVPILWPIVLSDFMKRLNVLVAAKQK